MGDEWKNQIVLAVDSVEYKLRAFQQRKPLVEFIASSDFPSWLKQPDANDFIDEKDYAIAFQFFTLLAGGLHKKVDFG